MTIRSARLLAITAAAAAMSAGLAFAQTSSAAPAAPTKPIPRAANGKPDLSGVWQGGGVSLYGDAADGTQRKYAAPVNPPPKREPLPYQAWAEAKSKTFTSADDPTLRCLLPGSSAHHLDAHAV